MGQALVSGNLAAPDCDACHSTARNLAPVELTREDRPVSENQRQPPRKAATKFAPLSRGDVHRPEFAADGHPLAGAVLFEVSHEP
jgi:hypothetical protein